jgi:hypothetical protein
MTQGPLNAHEPQADATDVEQIIPPEQPPMDDAAGPGEPDEIRTESTDG